MKRSFDKVFQIVTHAVTQFSGIGPTTDYAQGAPNAQAEQAQDQLAIPSLPFTLTEEGLFVSLRHHGSFSILPFELTTRIIHSFPAIETLVLRTVSKPFCLAWEEVAKNQLFSSKPTIRHLGLEQGCNALHEQQQVEIKYLIENRAAILEKNNNDPRLINAFAKLVLLENNSSLGAYHAKENCLNSLNETIIRIEIAIAQRSIKPVKPTILNLSNRHLTRFPSGIICDASLSEFWKEITVLFIGKNKLTTLPDNIGQCAALEALSVIDNELTTLPDTIGQCTKLQKLDASNNQLTTLPDTIGQCTKLWYLSVRGNQLTTLPDTLGQCAALSKLFVTENKLKALPNNLRDNIFFNHNYTINKADCLALQKKALIKNEEEAQKLTIM